MLKRALLAGAAAMVFAAPAYAQDVDAGATLDATITYNNNIDTSIVTDVSFVSDVTMMGDITVSGDVEVDAAATAVSDVKQITNGVAVVYEEDDEDDDLDGATGDREAGATNQADAGDVDVAGNAGVNAAAGYYNSQANVATIAVASGGENEADEDSGGMSTANTTSAQSLTGTVVGGADGGDSREANRATSGQLRDDGNVGVNSAAGAFNQQANIMTLAVATDSALAQASAGVVQFNNGNVAFVNDASNIADASGAFGSGNIAANVAAGTGNQQHNSLTVAASGAFGGNAIGGTDGGGGF